MKSIKIQGGSAVRRRRFPGQAESRGGAVHDLRRAYCCLKAEQFLKVVARFLYEAV